MFVVSTLSCAFFLTAKAIELCLVECKARRWSGYRPELCLNLDIVCCFASSFHMFRHQNCTGIALDVRARWQRPTLVHITRAVREATVVSRRRGRYACTTSRDRCGRSVRSWLEGTEEQVTAGVETLGV